MGNTLNVHTNALLCEVHIDSDKVKAFSTIFNSCTDPVGPVFSFQSGQQTARSFMTNQMAEIMMRLKRGQAWLFSTVKYGYLFSRIF